MFIPLIATITAGAIAAALIKLGALTVWVSILSVAVKAMTTVGIALTLALLWAVRSAR